MIFPGFFTCVQLEIGRRSGQWTWEREKRMFCCLMSQTSHVNQSGVEKPMNHWFLHAGPDLFGNKAIFMHINISNCLCSVLCFVSWARESRWEKMHSISFLSSLYHLTKRKDGWGIKKSVKLQSWRFQLNGLSPVESAWELSCFSVELITSTKEVEVPLGRFPTKDRTNAYCFCNSVSHCNVFVWRTHLKKMFSHC